MERHGPTGHDHHGRDRHGHAADDLDDRVERLVVDDPVVDPGSGGARDGRGREHRERPDPVERESEHELGRGSLDEPGQQRVDPPQAPEERRHAGRDHLGENAAPGLRMISGASTAGMSQTA